MWYGGTVCLGVPCVARFQIVALISPFWALTANNDRQFQAILRRQAGKLIRAFLGTPFRLRDDIPRDSVTPGLSDPGTKRYYMCGMWPPRDAFVRERGSHFYVARERDIGVCAGRDCAGTGFHIYDGTAIFLAGLDCCMVHPTPPHT